MLRPFILAQIAYLVGAQVTLNCRPRTNDDDDVAAAKLGTKLLQYYWQAGATSTLFRLLHAAWMVFCTGFVVAKTIWDPQRGNRSRFDPDEIGLEADPAIPDHEQRRLERIDRFRRIIAEKLNVSQEAVGLDEDGGIEQPSGDLYTDFVSGFDFTEPRNCKSIEDMSWALHSQFRSIEYGRERYGSAFDDVRAETDEHAHRYRTFERYGSAEYSGQDANQGEGIVPCDEVMVHELWRPRSLSCPEGYLCVIADHQLIKKGPNPYRHGRLPFVAISEMPDPEYLRPGCTVRDQMSLQRARNKNRSQWLGHFDKTVNPTILKEKASGLPEDAFSIDAPTIIEVAAGAIQNRRIEAFQYPTMPPYAMNLDEANRRDMEDVGRVHSNAMGKLESASQSGRAAALMQQANQRTAKVTQLLWEAAMQKIGEQQLLILNQFVKRQTQLTIAGEDNASEVIAFIGADLVKGSGKAFGGSDFNVTVGIGAEPNMQDVMAMIDTLTERGYLNPQREEDRRQVRRLLGDQYPGEVDPDAYHRANAAGEHRRLVDGEAIMAALGDNDAVHLDQHYHYTTTTDYRDAVSRQPNLATAMLVHVRDHQHQMAEKAIRPQIIAQVTASRLAAEYGMAPAAEQGGRKPSRTDSANGARQQSSLRTS